MWHIAATTIVHTYDAVGARYTWEPTRYETAEGHEITLQVNVDGITPNYRLVASSVSMDHLPYRAPKTEEPHLETTEYTVKEEPDEGDGLGVVELCFADTVDVGPADLANVKKSYAGKRDRTDYMPAFVNTNDFKDWYEKYIQDKD